jgi:hypothetical protein
LPDHQREKYLENVQRHCQQRQIAQREPIVFEGNVPAQITRNRRLMELLEAKDWPVAVSAPLAWLGEPVAIKDPTVVTFRRQSGANLLIIGQQEEPAMAIMAGAMISLAAQHGIEAAKFYVLDGTPADSPLSGRFAEVKEALPHELKLVEYRQVENAMTELGEELHRRQSGEEASGPAIYLFVHGLQRYRVLRKQEEGFSLATGDVQKPVGADKHFADLLREGAALGMHVIVWADTLVAVERTVDRAAMREFDNRVLFQLSAADSSNLIDSPIANRLGFHRALVYSEEQGVLEKFRPYALVGGEFLQRVGKALARSG